ncbi:MAG: hypothetical protein QXG39_01850 [Candidatus Aenigmatarchaeota archaeon]
MSFKASVKASIFQTEVPLAEGFDKDELELKECYPVVQTENGWKGWEVQGDTPVFVSKDEEVGFVYPGTTSKFKSVRSLKKIAVSLTPVIIGVDISYFANASEVAPGKAVLIGVPAGQAGATALYKFFATGIDAIGDYKAGKIIDKIGNEVVIKF